MSSTIQWCVDAKRLVVRHRLSLILCQHELPDDERFLEISISPDKQRYEIIQRSDRLVNVQSWPFEDKQFTVNGKTFFILSFSTSVLLPSQQEF